MTASSWAAPSGATDADIPRRAGAAVGDMRLSELMGGEGAASRTLLEQMRMAEELERARQEQTVEGGEEGWTNDPFNHLSDRMGTIERDLADARTDKPTQDTQQEVVDKIDHLIELLEKMGGGGGGGGGQGGGQQDSPAMTGSSPANDSTLQAGGDSPGELGEVKPKPRKWEDLSETQLEKIRQSQAEGFPSGYESLLEEYYRKLATESEGAGGP